MDSFIVILVFLLLSAISTWLQKRREGNEAGEAAEQWESVETRQESAPRSTGEATGSPPRRQASDWESELKRLLGGEPESPPAPRESQTTSRGSTAPAQPPPLVNRETSGRPSTYEKPSPSPPYRETKRPSREEDLAAAREKARRLKEQAAKKLEESGAAARRTGQRSYRRGTPAADARIALSRIRDPNTVRQAFVASLIFGPPKGMEQSD